MYFDSHLHFDHFFSQNKLDKIIHNAKLANVEKMIAVGGSCDSNALSIKLAQNYSNLIYASSGYDRELADKEYSIDKLKEQVSNPLVRAVGETGLDYFHTKDNKISQQKLFSLNLDLAVKFNKPVIVHSRAADQDTIDMLREFSFKKTTYPGVLHCFTLNKDCAKKLLDLGMMISFSGIITFANAEDLRDVVSYIPDDRLLIETDAPYLAPIPNRGKENEPAFIKHTAERIAQLRNCDLTKLAECTFLNASRLFGVI